MDHRLHGGPWQRMHSLTHNGSEREKKPEASGSKIARVQMGWLTKSGAHSPLPRFREPPLGQKEGSQWGRERRPAVSFFSFFVLWPPKRSTVGPAQKRPKPNFPFIHPFHAHSASSSSGPCSLFSIFLSLKSVRPFLHLSEKKSREKQGCL